MPLGDELSPVVNTPVGRVGLMVAAEAYVPEVARSLMLRGAEIILWCADDAGTPMMPIVARCRAEENRVFVACATAPGERRDDDRRPERPRARAGAGGPRAQCRRRGQSRARAQLSSARPARTSSGTASPRRTRRLLARCRLRRLTPPPSAATPATRAMYNRRRHEPSAEARYRNQEIALPRTADRARAAATLRARIGGYLVDMVIFAAIAMIVVVFAGFLLLATTDWAKKDPSDPQFYMFLAIIGLGTPLIWSALNLGLLATRSQTGGQYVAGIRTRARGRGAALAAPAPRGGSASTRCCSAGRWPSSPDCRSRAVVAHHPEPYHLASSSSSSCSASLRRSSR